MKLSNIFKVLVVAVLTTFASHSYAGKCQIWVIVIDGQSFVYYDPTDPFCPRFN